MRQLVIDTETTGLHPERGHRVIEVAAVELVERRLTGKTLRFVIDPEREIDEEAAKIHGKSWADLKGEARFADVAQEFVEFARGAEWIAHRASFDIAFLDRELALCGKPACAQLATNVIDSKALARETMPGRMANLDALCKRFNISIADRTLHGALLDAQLLAKVYLAMTREQQGLTFDSRVVQTQAVEIVKAALRVIEPSADELAAHAAYLADMKKGCDSVVWLR
jgi:DNA polymerase-3 subunit epsilon